MTGAFCNALERYGQTVELFQEGSETGTSLRAFVQAISNRSDEQCLPTPLGRARQDRFLYLGSPDGALDTLGEMGYILWRGGRFRVRSAHPVFVGETLHHWWAVLEPWEECEP